MRRIISSYVLLSRPERLGYAALTGMLLLLLIIWQTMPWWVTQPDGNDPENARLEAIYRAYVAAHPADAKAKADGYNTAYRTPVLFTFDPNTLDSAGFLRLGLSPKVVKGLMNWRRHGKQFYKKEDLKPLYNLTPEAYARLEPFIRISSVPDGRVNSFGSKYAALPALPATLNLNTTDSATLVRLNGIGPTLAHKIIARRTALGGYLKHEQLLEVYKFSDSTFTMLQQRLVIRPEEIRKIPVNTASLEALQSHPYIGEKTAKNIILYRSALKRYDQIGQLRQVPLMNEEIYRKIAPYLVVD